MKREPAKYSVWRHHRFYGNFTFYGLREWMLKNLPESYHAEIRLTKRGDKRGWNRPYSLAQIACNSEYCAVSRVWLCMDCGVNYDKGYICRVCKIGLGLRD